MANYSNAGTALMLFPISLIAGEGPGILRILTGQEPSGRLIQGILVTVRDCNELVAHRGNSYPVLLSHLSAGLLWIFHRNRRVAFGQDYLAHYPHDLIGRSGSTTDRPRQDSFQ